MVALQALAEKIATVEDPLLAFARENYAALMEGEPIVIPEAFRGVDPSTGRPRSSYAAKQQLERYVRQLASGTLKR